MKTIMKKSLHEEEGEGKLPLLFYATSSIVLMIHEQKNSEGKSM